jgi:dihydropyrimidinase
MGKDNFTQIPNGTAGVEERLAVLWEKGVNGGKITPNEFVAVTSTNAAKIFNMYPAKGAVREGSDADLVIWDPKGTKVISAETHMSNIETNIFEGMEITGVPVMTICNGNIAWQNGELLAKAGDGKYVMRPTYAPFYQSLQRRKALAEPKAVDRTSA